MLNAEDALHLKIECAPTYYMYCKFKLKFEMSSAIKMHFDHLIVSHSVHYTWSCYKCIMNICPISKRRTQRHSNVILCHSCHAEIHYNCCWLLLSDFENEIYAGKWFCKPCVEGFFHSTDHFEDDNDIMKCVQAMSHSSDIATGLQNSMKIFNPFDINEDDYEIIDYHSDIDPDRCYFNEYSYKIFKTCN